MSLFETGIRPAVDEYLKKKSEERRDYGDYWSASSAGYCMRKVIFDRLGVPFVKDDARKVRVFESGHIFHEWLQRITKDHGLSVAQEIELQDEDLMIRGHIDDLVLIKIPVKKYITSVTGQEDYKEERTVAIDSTEDHLILYDYKTVNSRAFSYKKDKMSYYHRMQLGTYMYMLRKEWVTQWIKDGSTHTFKPDYNLSEARIMNISKDDLRMAEVQLLWDDQLEKDVLDYWTTLNTLWKEKKLPKCTCADHEGGFMGREAYNPYFYQDEPCSLDWLKLKVKNKEVAWQP